MWIYDHFPASINVAQIRLYTMYFDSVGGATALFSNYAAAISETMQKPLSSLSTSCYYYYYYY